MPRVKKRVALLRILNCLDCPKHKELTAPSTGDSFDAGDTEIVCTEKGNRLISGGDRSWKHRDYCDVPSWCPLLKP